MYDANLLREAMASKGLNYYQLGRKAKVDPKTAKKVVTTGSGQPRSVKAIARALGFATLDAIVLRGVILRPAPKKRVRR